MTNNNNEFTKFVKKANTISKKQWGDSSPRFEDTRFLYEQCINLEEYCQKIIEHMTQEDSFEIVSIIETYLSN